MNRRIFVIFGLFLLLRLILAFRLPIFNDESIYMRWGWGFLQNPSHWNSWILDGKQPAVAISYGIAQLLPLDPLISMRLVSILWSSVTFFVTLALIRKIFPKVDPSWILLLIAGCPYLILFDTLALAESPITATFIMLFYLAVSFARNPTVKKGMLMGLVFAVGWWYKTTIYLSVPLVMVTIGILTDWQKKWKIVLPCFSFGIVLSLILMAPILVDPSAYVSAQGITRTNSVSQILSFPVYRWLQLGEDVAGWFIGFAGPFVVGAAIVACYIFHKKRDVWVLALWALFPIIAEIIVLTSMSGRLLVVSVIPILLMGGVWVVSVKQKVFLYIVAGTTLILGIILSVFPLTYYQLLRPDPAAQSDFSQYVVGWPSGWGVGEAVNKLTDLATLEPIVVFVRWDSGNPEDAVIAYMKRAHIPVFYLAQLPEVANNSAAMDRSWYFVSRGNQLADLGQYMTLVAKYPKPLDDEFVGVYRFNKK